MKEITLDFKKIVGEGKALGRHEGKVVFAYGVLPGETARVGVTLEKRNFMEAEVLEVITPSPMRLPPAEDHYISCSPWQIMNYELQAETKKGLVEDLLFQTIKETIRLDKFYPAKQLFGYRTKIEYSLVENEGKLAFAFHKRGSYRERYILDKGCALISPEVNALAFQILDALNELGLRAADVKTLILREAKTTGERLAVLFLKRKEAARPERLHSRLFQPLEPDELRRRDTVGLGQRLRNRKAGRHDPLVRLRLFLPEQYGAFRDGPRRDKGRGRRRREMRQADGPVFGRGRHRAGAARPGGQGLRGGIRPEFGEIRAPERDAEQRRQFFGALLAF